MWLKDFNLFREGEKNILGGENAGYQKCFQRPPFSVPLTVWIVCKN